MLEEELENTDEESGPVTHNDVGEKLSIDNAMDADDYMGIDLSDKYDG